MASDEIPHTAVFPRIAARRNHAQSVDKAPCASGNFQEESRPPCAARSVAGGTIGVRTTLQWVPFLAVCWTACIKKERKKKKGGGVDDENLSVARVFVFD